MVISLSDHLPSGKRLHNYGKIHHFTAGIIKYFYVHVQVRKLLVYQRVVHNDAVDLPNSQIVVYRIEIMGSYQIMGSQRLIFYRKMTCDMIQL